MSITRIDKKYLSVFIDRFIPDYISERFPYFKTYVKYFLEYLEQDEKIYREIVELIDYMDIDQIVEMSDDNKNEILTNLFNTLSFDGNEMRYISSLLDSESDSLYLKFNKTIASRKGIIKNFVFFFALLLNGYFRIQNIDNASKIYNGVFQYNGLIDYSYLSDSITPYVYLILSEFEPNDYTKILEYFNPAGVTNVKFFQKQASIDEQFGYLITDAWNYSPLYMALYQDTTFVNMVKIFKNERYEIITTDDYDFIMQNGTRLQLNDTGDYLYLEGITNINLAGSDKTFNNIKILKNPNPNTEYSYTSIISEGTIIATHDFTTSLKSEYSIINNTSIGILINYS